MIVSDDEATSPWSQRNGWRIGLPAQTLLALSCKGEHKVIALTGQQPTVQDQHLVIERHGVRTRHLAVRRGDTLYVQWDGELQAVSACDPLAAPVPGRHKKAD
ncbi:MAG: hypothetical protein ACFWT3_11800 [Pseudomonas lundensis]